MFLLVNEAKLYQEVIQKQILILDLLTFLLTFIEAKTFSILIKKLIS